MSKERARARAAREHEAALRTAARASAAERAERSAARARLLRRTPTRRRPGARPSSRLSPSERRRRTRTSALVACLLAVDVLVWAVRPDWPARLGIVVLTLLAAPLLLVLVPRR